MPEDFSSSSASIQLCSSTARTNERIRLPSWSSGVITYTGIALPSSKVDKISFGIESNSLPSMMPSDFAPMLTRIRLSERLAMMPSRISPAVGMSKLIPSASNSPIRLSMVTSGSVSCLFSCKFAASLSDIDNCSDELRFGIIIDLRWKSRK